ncbi:MAG: hypothetical protein GY856_34515 [bacterium]|nr:hypothetical protein [bacterium]
MAIESSDWIWMNGEWKRWSEATVHVSAHGLHYGSSVFEGIRAYETVHGTAIFRLREHLERLFNSARLLRLDASGFPPEELMEVSLELVGRNHAGACYLWAIFLRIGTTSIVLGAPASSRPGGRSPPYCLGHK